VSRENVEIVRALFDAVHARDSDTVLSLYHADVEWDGSRSRWGEVMPGFSTWRGHEGLRKFSQMYYEMWDELEDAIAEIVDAGDHVITVVNTRARGRSSGVEVELQQNVGVWSLRDGKVVRVVWF
jgi:ketosteroid isomerase-like protein